MRNSAGCQGIEGELDVLAPVLTVLTLAGGIDDDTGVD